MHANPEKVWSAAQENLRSFLNPEIYQLWFAPLRAVGMDAGSFTLEVADDFCEVWLKDNYFGLLCDVIASATGKQLEVKFRVAPNAGQAAHPPVKSKVAELPAHPAPARNQHHAGAEAEPGFNPRNTFDTFVVGNNQFAHSAALAVAQAPGKSYNPLFLYGGVGLGKTHLLHAIGHYTRTLYNGAKVRYVSSEEFTNEFINSIRDDKAAAFQRRYRDVDVLLVDDIQFLSGKVQTQEEFFHTFNTLHNANKQIVVTSDLPPKQLQDFEDRMRSRFEWGLITDVQPPDLETRIAILRKKVKTDGIVVPDQQILTAIAGRVSSNIRELEGALTRVVAFSSLTGRPMTVDLAEEVLDAVFPQGGIAEITISRIQELVSDRFRSEEHTSELQSH